MKLTKSKLQKLIQEELGNILEAHDKDSPSVTRPGEEDYTGHKGDISQTHPGEEDYEGEHPGHKDYLEFPGMWDDSYPGVEVFWDDLNKLLTDWDDSHEYSDDLRNVMVEYSGEGFDAEAALKDVERNVGMKIAPPKVRNRLLNAATKKEFEKLKVGIQDREKDYNQEKDY